MIFNLVLGAPFFGDLGRFLQQVEVDASEQLPHPGAGWPSELLFDGVERSIDCGDPPLDLLLDDVEVEGVVASVVLAEDLGLVVLTSDQLEY